MVQCSNHNMLCNDTENYKWSLALQFRFSSFLSIYIYILLHISKEARLHLKLGRLSSAQAMACLLIPRSESEDLTHQ